MTAIRFKNLINNFHVNCINFIHRTLPDAYTQKRDDDNFCGLSTLNETCNIFIVFILYFLFLRPTKEMRNTDRARKRESERKKTERDKHLIQFNEEKKNAFGSRHCDIDIFFRKFFFLHFFSIKAKRFSNLRF